MHGSLVTACGSPVARMSVRETYANQLFQDDTACELLAAIPATNFG